MRRRTHPKRPFFFKSINPVVRFLVLSDILVIGAAGLLAPIFALFIEDFIVGGNEAVAGMAAGVYLLSRSLLQIPVAHILDKIPGERDDYWTMIIFSGLTGLVPLLYLIVDTPVQLYMVQFLLGICSASTYPIFMAIFSRHIDKHKESTEYSIYYTLTDISSAGLAMGGGYLAASAGFDIVIITVTIMTLLGTLMLLPIKPYLRMR